MAYQAWGSSCWKTPASPWEVYGKSLSTKCSGANTTARQDRLPTLLRGTRKYLKLIPELHSTLGCPPAKRSPLGLAGTTRWTTVSNLVVGYPLLLPSSRDSTTQNRERARQAAIQSSAHVSDSCLSTWCVTALCARVPSRFGGQIGTTSPSRATSARCPSTPNRRGKDEGWCWTC